MKKKILVLFSILLLVGCSLKPTSGVEDHQIDQEVKVTTDLKILSPSGAPALALVDLFENSAENITVVEGADVLQASLISPDSKYDVIVAPTNLGVKLAQSGKSNYRLAAIVTWGNLVVLAESDEVLHSEELVFAAFGEQAVPGLVFEQVKNQLGVDEVTYYSAVTEAQAALLSGKATAALIAEPAATATIEKAKEKELNLSVVADIQALWEAKTGSKGYPQASIFIRETDDNKAQIDELLTYISNSLATYQSAESSDNLILAIDTASAEVLGLPNAQVVAKSYSRMGLQYRVASECEKELTDFLALFGITYDASIAVR